MQEAHIKSVRELLGPRVYLILRVDNNDFETALVAARCGVDDVVTRDADSKKWSAIAGSARIRLLKFESYVFVDEISQNLLALVERVGRRTSLPCCKDRRDQERKCCRLRRLFSSA